MKLLWLCRWFGDYRIPIYDELNTLTGGNFYMIYSKDAVSPRVHKKMKDVLGENAIALRNERHLIIGNTKSDFANRYIDIAYQPALLSTIGRVNADIIISDGFFQWTYAALLKSRKRKVCVFYERTVHTERGCSKWRYKYRQWVGKYVDGFIINGQLTREYLEQMGFGHTPKVEGCMVADSDNLMRDVENCSNEEKMAIKRDLYISGKGLIFLCVGQIVERKGIKELLQAWMLHIEKFPEDHLIIIGEGILRKNLMQQYADVSSVHMIGQIDYDLIHKFYAIADVFIMPTLEDNWSLVVPEAMACGLPVATTIYNGCHVELLKNGENGYIFDSLKQDEMLKCLSDFHDADLKRMSMESKKVISNYTPQIAADKIYGLCKQITYDD